MFALVVRGEPVYVGGAFGRVGRQNRSCLAAVDNSIGFATLWNPGVNGAVSALAIGEGTVYAGGCFTRIKDLRRDRFAALAPGLPLRWIQEAE